MSEHRFGLQSTPTQRPILRRRHTLQSTPTQHPIFRRSSIRYSLSSSDTFKKLLKERQSIAKKNLIKLNKLSLITKTIHKLSEIITNTFGDGGFRAAIFGLSDGLATNLCLIIGIQFAIMNDDNQQQLDHNKIYDEIIRTGIAGIFGGAVSMALGEYLSMSAQTEMIQSEIKTRKQLLDDDWMEQMNILKEILSKTLSKQLIK